MRGLAHGQVWWADMAEEKIRPVVVLTRARVASRLTRVVVAPVTTTRRDIPTEVTMGRAEGVADGSVANVDNVQLLDVDRLIHRAGHVSGARWAEFCGAVERMMGCTPIR